MRGCGGVIMGEVYIDIRVHKLFLGLLVDRGF